MAFSYDISTDRGKVRRLANDVAEAAPIFQDEEVDAFLSLEAGSVKRAAALALETIARSEVYTQKVMRLLDLQTDGAAVARELRLQAKELRDQAGSEEAGDEGAAFDWAELVTDPFSARERIHKEYLRHG